MEGTRLKLAVREVAPASEEAARRSTTWRVLEDAAALLPWRGLGKPSRERLALHALLAPLWYLPGSAIAAALMPLGGAGLAAYVGLTAAFVLLAPAVFALVFSLAFHRFGGGRVHQALVCPYCRDEVGRDDALVCARTKCGALYHRECWDECATLYGGCAVYGCSSKRSREVTAAGFVLRLLRLGLAAVLFPPRAVRALRRYEEETPATIYRSALGAARRVYSFTNRDGGIQSVLVLLLGVPLSYLVLFGIFKEAINEGTLGGVSSAVLIPAILFGIPFLMLVLPYLLAIPPAFAFFLVQAANRALAAELSALGRADQGGGTVLGRLAAGFGKKECC
ncbi:MAG TPA: hypothetical protein VFF73_08125 [Planctomycetota bacterium]|nr:hypothetical protein [Planctomycetota bacterium]